MATTTTTTTTTGSQQATGSQQETGSQQARERTDKLDRCGSQQATGSAAMLVHQSSTCRELLGARVQPHARAQFEPCGFRSRSTGCSTHWLCDAFGSSSSTTTATTSVAIAAQIDMAAPRGRGRGRNTSASMGRCELRRLTGTTTAATTATTTPLAIARITAGRRGSPSAVFRIHEHVLVAERAMLAGICFFGEHF